MSDLVLSLFPGIGLLDMAFEDEGYCVVRGPDLLWGGDIHRFHPPAGRFDGVIGGPPCQAFSRLVHIVRHRYGEAAIAENLIPEFERCVAEAEPGWFLMENVLDAPMPTVSGYSTTSVILDNRWVVDAEGVGAEQERKRKFVFGSRSASAPVLWRHLELATLENPAWAPAVLANGMQRAAKFKLDRGGIPKRNRRLSTLGYTASRDIPEALRLFGLPADFFDHSPLTVEGKQRMLGNGVPRPLGRAIAKAVKAAVAELRGQAA